MSMRQRIRRLARDLEGDALTAGEALALITGFATVVKRHVSDHETLRAIAADLRRLAATAGAKQ